MTIDLPKHCGLCEYVHKSTAVNLSCKCFCHVVWENTTGDW